MNQNPPPHPTNPVAEGNSGKQKVLIFAVLLLLVFGGLNVWQVFRNKNSAAEAEAKITQTEASAEDLRQQNTYLLAQLDSLRTLSGAQATEIEQLKLRGADIENSIASGDLADAKRQIEALTRDKDAFLLKIAQLERALDHSQNEVQTVRGDLEMERQRSQQLSSDLGQTSTQLEQERSNTSALATENVQLTQAKQAAEAKIEANAFLTISNLEMKTLNFNKKGTRERETRSARGTDQVKICFQVKKNPLVAAGEQRFQIRIMAGDGQTTLYVESKGSGVGSDRESGQDFRFSTEAICKYQDADTEACGIWQIDEERMRRGVYKVDIFHRGRKVGSGEFKLK